MEMVNLAFLADKWQSALVARELVAEFSGGILSPKYMANLDAAGTGPEGVIRLGRKVAYPVQELIKWMQNRAQVKRKRTAGSEVEQRGAA